MISLPNTLPLVQWNTKRNVPLSEGWLAESIYKSAEIAGYYQWEMSDEIARALAYYLQSNYHDSLISVNHIQHLMRASLCGVGKEDIAKHAMVIAPRVSIYLPEIAHKAPYELIFFQALRERLQEAVEVVVRGVKLEGLKPCVKIIERAERWHSDCRHLSKEIVAYARNFLSADDQRLVELVIS
jgi:hypothetical protein